MDEGGAAPIEYIREYPFIYFRLPYRDHHYACYNLPAKCD